MWVSLKSEVKLVAAVDVVHLEGFSTGDQAMPSLHEQNPALLWDAPW